jgi:hypothetical protein
MLKTLGKKTQNKFYRKMMVLYLLMSIRSLWDNFAASGSKGI